MKLWRFLRIAKRDDIMKNIARSALMQILVENCVPAYPRISSPSSMLTPKATSPRVVY